MNLYFIGVVPSKKLSKEIRLIKEEFKLRYLAKHALKLPAHITLIPPFRSNREGDLIIKLREFSAGQKEFQVCLDGFGSFSPKVIFVDISNSKQLEDLQRDLFSSIKDYLPEEINSEKKFHPHITLATKDLYRKKFKDAWEDFRNRKFSAYLKVNKLSLFKHNGKTWDVYKEFRFE